MSRVGQVLSRLKDKYPEEFMTTDEIFDKAQAELLEHEVKLGSSLTAAMMWQETQGWKQL